MTDVQTSADTAPEPNPTYEAPPSDAPPRQRDPAAPLGVRELFEAGVHFGHQTKRWNPKMRPFIYGARSGIHIVDLDQTARLFKRAFDFLSDTVSRGGSVLFVGTKRQAAGDRAGRGAPRRACSSSPTAGSVAPSRTSAPSRVASIACAPSSACARTARTSSFRKRRSCSSRRSARGSRSTSAASRAWAQLPQAVFIIDPAQESIAVSEARKLHVPIVAITDTNCDPDLVDYVIPGNDDAIRSVRLITGAVADACVYGLARRREHLHASEREGGGGPGPRAGSDTQVIYAPRGPRAGEGEN